MKKTWKKVRAIVEIDGILSVELSNGSFAKIDEESRHLVEHWNWTARVGVAGTYAYRIIDKKKSINMHHVIAGATIGQRVDHRNRDTLDNRRVNLRISTNPQNSWNRGPKRNSLTGLKGVKWAKHNRWTATITPNGIAMHLGSFSTPEDAARAYDRAAVQFYGEFAYLNFPDDLPDVVSALATNT